MDLSLLLQEMKLLSREAGQLALKMWDNFGAIEYKGEKDVVTAADFACNELIASRLKALIPAANIWTEESAPIDQGSEWTWLADPIDGTVN